jgi:Ca2+-binding RTX toxin-like protein
MMEANMAGRTFIGTPDNDFFYGTTADDVFRGYEGDDTFHHSRGNDVFDGGADTDTVTYAHDELSGRTQGVYVDLSQGIGKDGEGGLDHYISIENVVGTDFADTLMGNGSDNVLTGGKGLDTLYGYGGQDILVAQVDDRLVDGGTGIDNLVLEYGQGFTTVTLNDDGSGSIVSAAGTVQLKGIENVEVQWVLSSPDPTQRQVVLTGNKLGNMLIGGNGVSDVIDGGDGSDTLVGGHADLNGMGHDTFVFHHGASHPNQHDVIGDFEPGVDVIDLRDTPVQDFNDLFTPGDRYMVDTSAGVVIHTSDNAHTSILLQGVSSNQLSQSDFLF